jgi:ankyrin repeat protein
MWLSPLQVAMHRNNNIHLVRTLLENGANRNNFSPHAPYGTPIQLATETKNIEMVEILLRYRANPDAIFGRKLHTALQMAAREGQKDIAELLIEHGADVNFSAAPEDGATTLQFAAITGFLGIAYLLIENGADVNAPPTKTDGRIALEGATEHGRIEMVQMPLNAGVNIYGDGEEQFRRALGLAEKNGHFVTKRLLEEYHG